MATQPMFIEEELGRKWDKCITDGILKFGGGLVLGTVFSLLFFKRKRWPVIMGAGFGVGVAYSNCEKELNSTLRECEIPAKSTGHDKDKPHLEEENNN